MIEFRQKIFSLGDQYRLMRAKIDPKFWRDERQGDWIFKHKGAKAGGGYDVLNRKESYYDYVNRQHQIFAKMQHAPKPRKLTNKEIDSGIFGKFDKRVYNHKLLKEDAYDVADGKMTKEEYYKHKKKLEED